MLKVWLYGYAVGMTSARRLEQRIREDLGLRDLAGGQLPDHWALSALRRRHGRPRNDGFAQVVEMTRKLGLGKLGMVAVDSTRIRANASRDRMDTEQRLRKERARLRRQIRRWQKAWDASDADEGVGTRVQVEKLEQRLAELPGRLERLRQSGEAKRSRRDGEARFLPERGGFNLGYTAEVAGSEDPCIVAQRGTLNRSEVPARLSRLEEVEQRSRARPDQVLADAGFYRNENVRA